MNKKVYPYIEFLSIGHFTHDVVNHNFILGGAAAYSSKTATKLGIKTGVITSVGEDFIHFDKLNGIPIALINKNLNGIKTTTFQNIYENGIRRQFIRSVSETIKPEHIPQEWIKTSIVYICPVANEVEPSIVHSFPNSIIGASPQGWMRCWNDKGMVSQKKWEYAEDVLPYIDALIMSEEDISATPEVVDEYAKMVHMLILTRGERGSTLFYEGKIVDFPAFKTEVFDPTGAGDVFATAFLIKYKQTNDPYEASVFANCTASFVVEKQGMDGIPDIEQVKLRLATKR